MTLFGGLGGPLLLMVPLNEAFYAVVPGLLLFATLAFLLGDRLRRFAAGLAKGEGMAGMTAVFAARARR